MRITELEDRLRLHADITKSTVAAPFPIESEVMKMSNKNHIARKTVLIVAAVVCILGMTTFAAYQYINAGDVASRLGDTTLAGYFEKVGAVCQTIEDGRYKATLLGLISGENLSDFDRENEPYPDRTYAVVAVEKTDGSAMTADDTFTVTPLIQGCAPWQFNIFYTHGGYTDQIIDGVNYRIISCDNIEYFADRKIYMAVTDKMFINNEPFGFDPVTGEISPNEAYNGTNILFDLELDRTKADPEKAAEYLKLLEIDEASEEEATEDELPTGEDVNVRSFTIEAGDISDQPLTLNRSE